MKRTLLLLAGVLVLTSGVAAQETSDTVDTVMLASDANFPDALVASGPAEKLGIPVLITGPDELPDETQQALEELNPSEIEIVGGPAVVSDDLETLLEQDYTVTRHWGMTQVGTAAALAEAFWPTGAEEAVIVQYPLDGDAYWENGYKLLAALRGEIDERPVLISKEGTLSSATIGAASDLNVSEATVYSTDAVNVTEDLTSVGVDDVSITEREITNLMQAIKDDEEREDEMSQSRPLVAVAAGSYRDALAVSSSPDAASYLISDESEIAGLIDRINTQNVSRVIVTGEPGLAATIADQVRSETDVDVKETSGGAAAASASNVRDSRSEWAQQQQKRVGSFREQVSSSASFGAKVERLLTDVETELNQSNRSEDGLRDELDEAWTDYQNGEYLDAHETAQKVRSELSEIRYEQARANQEAVRELVRSERESVSDLMKETGDLARDFSEEMREAETPQERRQIIEEFRTEREDLIQKHRDSIRDMLKDRPGRGPWPGEGDDDRDDENETENDEISFTTQWGEGELEIEADDGEVTVEGEARVNYGGYTVDTESSSGDGRVDVTFNLVPPEDAGTTALTTVSFSETIAVTSGEHTVTTVVQIDGDEIFKHDETVMVSTEDDDEINETEPEEGENETEEQEDSINETDDDAEVDREIDVEGGSYYFEPDVINVSVGDTVEFTLENEGGRHDLRIPAFDVGTDRIFGGDEASFTYTFEEEGRYEFLCSVANHAEQGMTGTINVNPVGQDEGDTARSTATVQPEDASFPAGTNATVSLGVTVDGRIGVYSVTLELDGDIDGSIRDVSFPQETAMTDVSYSDDRSGVTIAVIGMNASGIDGTTLADVVVTGEQAGTAELRVRNLEIGDVSGNQYQPDPKDSVLTVEQRAGNASIHLSSINVSSGQPFSIDLRAEGDNVAGYSANLSYDHETIAFYQAAGSAVFDDPVTNRGQGWVMITAANAQGTDDPLLATLSFESAINATGVTAVQFLEDDTKLNDAQAELPIASYESGEVLLY